VTITCFNENIVVGNTSYYIYTFTGISKPVNLLIVTTAEQTDLENQFSYFLVNPPGIPVQFPTQQSTLIYFSGDLSTGNYIIDTTTNTKTLLTFSNTITISSSNNVFSGSGFNYFIWLFKAPINVVTENLNPGFLYVKLYYSDNALLYSAFLDLVPETETTFTNDKTFEIGPLNDNDTPVYVTDEISVGWKANSFFNLDTLQFNDLFHVHYQGTKISFDFVEFLPPGTNQLYSPNFSKYFAFSLNENMYSLVKFDIETTDKRYLYVLIYEPCNSSNYVDSGTPPFYNGVIFYGPKKLNSFSELEYISKINSGVSRLNDILPDNYDATLIWVGGSSTTVYLNLIMGYKIYQTIYGENVDIGKMSCSLLPNNGFKDNSLISQVYNFSIGFSTTILLNDFATTFFIRILRYSSDSYNNVGYLYYTNAETTDILTPLTANNSNSSSTNYVSYSQEIQVNEKQSLKIIWKYGIDVSKPTTYTASLITSGSQIETGTISVLSNPPDKFVGNSISSIFFLYRGIYQVSAYFWIFSVSGLTLTINGNPMVPIILMFNSVFNTSLLLCYFYLIDQQDFKTNENEMLVTLFNYTPTRIVPTSNSLPNEIQVFWNPSSAIENFGDNYNLLYMLYKGTAEPFTLISGNQVARELIAYPPLLPNAGRDPQNMIDKQYLNSEQNNVMYSFLIEGKSIEKTYFIFLIGFFDPKENEQKRICLFFDSESNKYVGFCPQQKYTVSVKTTSSCVNDSLSILWNGNIPQSINDIDKVISINPNVRFANPTIQTFTSQQVLFEYLNQQKIMIPKKCSSSSSIKTFNDSYCSSLKNQSIALYVIVGVIVLVVILIGLFFLFKFMSNERK